MLCYHYPPSNNGGTERSVKFVQYLPEFGWSPKVITTNIYGKSNSPKESVVYTPEVMALVRKLRSQKPSQLSTPSKSKPAFWRNFVVLDPQIGWGVFAFWAGLREILQEGTDVIFSTSPPVSSHMLALVLKWVTRKPWVMDLRDPWTFEPISHYLEQSPLRLRNEQRIERLCFRYADRIIINTPQSAARYQKIYPQFTDKMTVITNGFDTAEMEQAINIVPSVMQNFEEGTFVISHTGNFERRPNVEVDARPHEFLRGIKHLIEARAVERNKLRVIFAGGLPSNFNTLIEEMALQDVVLLPGRLSHLETLSLIQRSDLLMLYQPYGDGVTYVRGKLYEYLGSGKPILGIVPEGASRDLMKQYGHHWLVYPGDVETTIEMLRTAIRNAGLDASLPADYPQFERKNLTQQLVELLNSLIVS